MELLQKIDLQASVSGQKSSDKSISNTESKAADMDNKSFKEQLNKQVDQVKTKYKQDKLENNQQDKGVASESNSVNDETADNADVVKEPVAAVSGEALEKALQKRPAEQITEELSDSMLATLLPGMGSALPPVNSSLEAVKAESVVKSPVSAAIVAAPVVSQSLQSEVDQQQQNALMNKTLQLVESQKKQTTVSAESSVKPLNVPANLSNILSEKANVQDARFTKIVSEMPAADVIAQTTKLQQVPLTTAISASVNAAQNVSVSATVETTALNNNLNSLNNTLSSSIPANIQNPNWSQQMNQQVAYMVKGGFQQAEIKLNPANLGPMEIKLSVNDDKASISFIAQHAPVRDALDSAIPRLREMLEQQGLNLSDVNVSTQSEQQRQGEESSRNGAAGLQSGEENENSSSAEQQHSIVVNMESGSGISLFV